MFLITLWKKKKIDDTKASRWIRLPVNFYWIILFLIYLSTSSLHQIINLVEVYGATIVTKFQLIKSLDIKYIWEKCGAKSWHFRWGMMHNYLSKNFESLCHLFVFLKSRRNVGTVGCWLCNVEEKLRIVRMKILWGQTTFLAWDEKNERRKEVNKNYYICEYNLNGDNVSHCHLNEKSNVHRSYIILILPIGLYVLIPRKRWEF